MIAPYNTYPTRRIFLGIIPESSPADTRSSVFRPTVFCSPANGGVIDKNVQGVNDFRDFQILFLIKLAYIFEHIFEADLGQELYVTQQSLLESLTILGLELACPSLPRFYKNIIQLKKVLLKKL